VSLDASFAEARLAARLDEGVRLRSREARAFFQPRDARERGKKRAGWSVAVITLGTPT
jgi:hypothetical protein